MRCPPCNCTQPGTCSAMFQHEGMAVVNRGTGLHMPTEPEDVPIIDAEGAQFWAIAAGASVVVVFACIGVATVVHFFLRG